MPSYRRCIIRCIIGMRVLGLRRTAQPGQPPPAYVDALYPLSDLHAVLGLADFVVLAMPQTPQSEGMIGKVRHRPVDRQYLSVSLLP